MPPLLPRSWLPWLSLLGLWLLFELPLALISLVPDLQRVRFHLELPLLWTLAALDATRWHTRWLRAGLRAAAALLVLFRLDQWLCLLLMRDEPLLYDQWFMARHLGVLLGDLLSPLTFVILLGVGLLGWGLLWLVRELLRRARGALERWPSTRIVLASFWTVMLALGLLVPTRVGWLSASLLDNVRASREVHRSVREAAVRSPHRARMATAPSWRPDVLLFIVESYGRLLSAEPETRAGHLALLHTLEGELGSAGFEAVSAFGTATVSGGRSWIAEGTLLMGMPIKYESVFQHLIPLQPPNLVSYLNRHGYHTVLLAPADRDRPGAHVVNRYGYDQLISHDTLGYRGAPIGWGLVPDRFSLEYAERHALQPRAEPVFLDFHMVSSHAPWTEVPSLDAASVEVPPHEREPSQHGSALGTVWTRMGRYDRGARRFDWMEQFDDALRDGYRDSVHYDLRLIARYLARRQRDALVIVLGDHQPPVLSRADTSFDTPIHVITRDRARLSPLREHGFVDGLALPPLAPPTLGHQDLLPLLLQLLTQS